MRSASAPVVNLAEHPAWRARLENRATARHCAHCGVTLPAGSTSEFCCSGCAAAREIIGRLGLESFYRRFAADPAARPLKPEAMPEPIDYAGHATRDKAGHCTLHLMVEGLHCAACVWLIEAVLARDARVLEGRVNMTTRRLRLRWHGAVGEAADIVGRLSALGFRLVPYDARLLASASSREERNLLRAMAVAGFATGNVMLLSLSVWSGPGSMGLATRDLMHWLSALIALPAIAYAGPTLLRFRPRGLARGSR